MTTKMKDAALYYASVGLPVFPLNPGDKRPATGNGFKAATTDIDRIQGWWESNPDFNIGMPAEAIGVIIDVDPRNGGNESLLKFREQYGLPDTIIVETGGDGLHYWYTTPQPITKVKLEGYPGIDVQGVGSYVVVPPSIHSSGKAYAFAAGHELGCVKPVAAPAGLIAESKRLESEKERRVKQSDPSTAGPLTHADMQELRRDLLRLDPRMHNDDWISIGMAMHSTGWAGMFELWDEWSSGEMHPYLKTELNYPGTRELRARWNSFRAGGGKTISTIKYYTGTADPNFVARAIHEHTIEDQIARVGQEPDVDVDHFIEQAQSYVDKLPAPKPQAPHTKTTGKLVMRSPGEYRGIAPPKWRTDSLWPESGLAALFGPSGVGKTFLVLEDMISAYAAQDFLGCENPKSTGSVYVCLEGNIGIRLLAALQHHEIAPEDTMNHIGVLTGSLSLNDRTEAAVLSNALFDYKESGGRFKTVYIDTMARAFGGGDENSSSDMGNVIREAQDIAATHDCLVILVHHTGKNEMAGLRGHSSLFAACDTVVAINGKSGEPKGVEVLKQKDSESRDLNGYDLQVVTLEPSVFTHGHPMRESERTSCVVVETESRPSLEETLLGYTATLFEIVKAHSVDNTGALHVDVSKQWQSATGGDKFAFARARDHAIKEGYLYDVKAKSGKRNDRRLRIVEQVTIAPAT